MSTLSPRTEVRQSTRNAWVARVSTALPTALSSIAAVAIALVVGALVLVVSGDDAIVAYRALFAGAFGGVRPITEDARRGDSLDSRWTRLRRRRPRRVVQHRDRGATRPSAGSPPASSARWPSVCRGRFTCRWR